MKLTSVRVFAWLLLLSLQTTLLIAQPSFPTNPNQAPIDGDLSILAAAGGIYAYKKLRKTAEEEE